MRICHGLLGETIDVDEESWRKPLDVVREHACSRWGLDVDDLIVLAGGGAVVGPDTTAEELCGKGESEDAPTKAFNVFVFLRRHLSGALGTVEDTLSNLPVAPEEQCRDDSSDAWKEEEQLRLKAASDPALEAFRGNIEEARKRVHEARPVLNLAKREEVRLDVHRQAVKAVLDNLLSHTATCGRSLTLFMQKYDRVQETLEHNLSQVEPSLEALAATQLHPALCAPGKETLLDVLPRDRLLQFTSNLKEERDRLAQRLDKLRQRHSNVQALCDQVVEKLRHLLDEEAAQSSIQSIENALASVQASMLPELCACVPPEGASPSDVLEYEKRSRDLLEGLNRVCSGVWHSKAELSVACDRQREAFLARLREVAYLQAKVREVERQAALLEEEINAQLSGSQDLAHLRRMPKAYQKLLSEIARRKEFKARYLDRCTEARNALARMKESENARRKDFNQRYGVHLPAPLFQGCSGFSPGGLVPTVSVEVPDFDVDLPEVVAAAFAATAAAPQQQLFGTADQQPAIAASPSAASGGDPDDAVLPDEAGQAPASVAQRIEELEARQRAVSGGELASATLSSAAATPALASAATPAAAAVAESKLKGLPASAGGGGAPGEAAKTTSAAEDTLDE
eukprot:TRINITY_DN39577_c0_g4_i2.p1 TRINITY_DN39577_c0_g4~~TRINITY_DN39577_c0_g4_i2.p1  ORF type:complete len:628 (+),score=176.15 TRINITY_DN39577_c0_g4_i2:201-2084(+)